MAPVISTLELQLSMDGGTVLAALSDGHGLMVVGERPDATQQLARLEPLWSAATDARGRNAVGVQLLEALIPERVRRHLDTASANGAPANLNLRIHPLLALVPWEALFDGERTWQDTYRLTRSILGKRGTTQARGPTSLPSATIELLLCAVGQAAGEASLHSLKVLTRALHEVPQLSVRAVSAEALRDEGESANANLPDIVQLTGTLEDMLCALEQDAHLRAQLLSAKLLVLDCASAQSPAHQWSPLGERLARLEAMPATLCLVRRGTPTKQASQHVEQMRRMYEQLALGEAVGRSAPEGSAVFGDASLVLASSPAPVSAERSFRQVTALSNDLVGSTELMHSLGAEAYSLALQRFHQRFAPPQKKCIGPRNMQRTRQRRLKSHSVLDHPRPAVS